MRKKDALNLNNGETVIHARYGESMVCEVMMGLGDLFGVKIEPQTESGRALLRLDAGITCDLPFLESSLRRLRPNDGAEG